MRAIIAKLIFLASKINCIKSIIFYFEKGEKERLFIYFITKIIIFLFSFLIYLSVNCCEISHRTQSRICNVPGTRRVHFYHTVTKVNVTS